MKNFIVFSRNDSEEIENIILKIESLIKGKGGKVKKLVSKDDIFDLSLKKQGFEAIIAVGGDGTMVYASKASRLCDIPVIGVHKGHLGYLCDIDEKSLEKGIRKLLVNNFDIEERMMLCADIQSEIREKKIVSKNEILSKKDKFKDSYFGHTALNDVVISKKQNTSVINLSIYVNGRYLYSYNCDGMIFATPTGSTAYNLSANGPIVDPDTKLILLNPINPHTLNSRTIVLDKDSVIEVLLNKRYAEREESADVVLDGEYREVLHCNEKLIVKRADTTAKMIRFSKTSFLKRIRKKFSDA